MAWLSYRSSIAIQKAQKYDKAVCSFIICSGMLNGSILSCLTKTKVQISPSVTIATGRSDRRDRGSPRRSGELCCSSRPGSRPRKTQCTWSATFECLREPVKFYFTDLVWSFFARKLVCKDGQDSQFPALISPFLGFFLEAASCKTFWR